MHLSGPSSYLLILLFYCVSPVSSWAEDEQPGEFNSAMESIIVRSTGVAVEEANLSAVQAKNLPSRLVFLPTLYLGAKRPLTGISSFLSVPEQVEITSQWNLFRWGADYFGFRSADAERDIQKSLVDSTVLQVEQDAVQALVTEIQRKKEIQVNSEIVKVRTELLSVAQSRYKRGYLPTQEVEKLQVDLENARASLTNAEIIEAEARASLEALLGHSEITVRWPWITKLKGKQASFVLDHEFEVTRRPDWLSANSQVRADSFKVSRNWQLLFPSFDAQFSYGHYNSYFGSVTGWTGAVSVTVPIFDHLQGFSKAKEQSHIRAASESRLEQVQRNAKAQWEASRIGFKKALESALTRERTLILSRKLYDDNLRRFQAGRITANDLAVDQNRKYEAELYAIQGWSTVHIHFSRLCHSLGYRVKECFAK